MITKNNYYIGDYYIPQAKPSISSDALGVDNSFNHIVNVYEEDCLVKCLGNTLYREFADQLDLTKSNLLKDDVDQKWDRLLNGHSYTKQGSSKLSYWSGLRYKSPIIAESYNSSLLVPYVYFHYQSVQFTDTTTTGEKKNKSQNAETVNPTAKVVKAWNAFVEQAQGRQVYRELIMNRGLFGIDYFKGDYTVSLYDFIKDMNKVELTYEHFEPKEWELMNEFNL